MVSFTDVNNELTVADGLIFAGLGLGDFPYFPVVPVTVKVQ